MEKELNKQRIAFNRGKLLSSSNIDFDIKDLSNKRNLEIISLIKELDNLGYSLCSDLVKRLTSEEIKEIYNTVVSDIQELFSEREAYIPLYPNFPNQVISKDEADLFVNQNTVYLVGVDEFQKQLEDDSYCDSTCPSPSGEKKLIGIMTEKEFMEIPNQIMSSNNSLTETTRQELLWFLDNFSDLKLPERIPFKETLCLVVSKREDYQLNEINDVLRYGIYLMGGDPSLVNVPQLIREGWTRKLVKNPNWRNLKSLSRKKRREICSRIDRIVEQKKVENCIPDAKKFYGHWVLLSERLHPGEYFLNYPECFEFFHKLKTKGLSKDYRTFDSTVQKMYRDGKSLLEIAKFVSSRPGEFVRRFDSIFRKANDNEKCELLELFASINGMKNKTLLELRDYYDNRNGRSRIINIPGKGSYSLKPLEPITDSVVELVQEVIERKVILNIASRVTEKDLEGKKVYIDPKIKLIPIPKGMREKSISIPVGTKFDIPEEKNKIRFFLHWIQNPSGPAEDLDLHAYLYNKNTGKSTNIGWNTGLNHSGVMHSGDVLNRPGKCAEYIDVNIDKVKEDGYTHIVTDIYNYKSRGIDTLPCWCGYSTNVGNFGVPTKNWYPENVDLMVPMKSKCVGVAAFMVDIIDRKLVILDCDFNGFTSNSDRNNPQKNIVDFFSVERKFSSYDILAQYYESRGATIINVEPPIEENSEEESNDIVERLTFSEISQDYVKILDIIGE